MKKIVLGAVKLRNVLSFKCFVKKWANFQLKNIHNYKWRHKYLNTKLVPPLKILFYTCIVWKTLPVQVFWRHFSMRRVRRLKNEARQIGGGGFILSDTMYECVSKPDYLPCHRRRGSEKLHTRDVMYECSLRGTHTPFTCFTLHTGNLCKPDKSGYWIVEWLLFLISPKND